jgi:hypothetical protein
MEAFQRGIVHCFFNKQIMSFKHIIVPYGNTGNPEAPKRFCARVKSKSELMFCKLSRKIDGKFPAVSGKFHAVVGKLSAVVEEFPAIIDMFPATVDKRPAIIGNIPAVVERSPAAIGKFPAVVEKSPAVVGESPVVVGKFPVAGKQSDEYTINDILARYI